MTTIDIKHPQQMAKLRRFSLAAQGLLQNNPFGNGLAGARKAINHLGYVQLDTISVIERAHHHVFHSRVPNFTPEMTNKMLLKGDIFEYWAHAAALLPIDDFRFSLPYKHAIASGQTHWFKDPDRKLMKELIARVHIDGPIRSRDLDSEATKSNGWWDWKPAKKALEQLYMQGDLMVCDRQGFQKTYDLTERVLPSKVNTKIPSVKELAAYLLEQQLQNYGLVSLKGLTYQRKNKELRKAMLSLLNEKLAQGELQQIRFASGAVYFVGSGTLERSLPRVKDRLIILSPFDNSVIQRERLEALFQFEYRLECYLPSAKRRFGYFSLPLLFRDHFIGRMDCKVHRKSKCLEIKSLHWEAHSFNQDAVNSAFLDAMKDFCQFQDCESVALSDECTQQINKSLLEMLN